MDREGWARGGPKYKVPQVYIEQLECEAVVVKATDPHPQQHLPG